MENEATELPDYLKQTDAGDYDITLRKGITIEGVKVSTLRMREPTVQDNLVQEATKGSDGIKEMTMFANLCDITVDDVKKLGLHDYRRVQQAFTNFIV